MSATFTIKINAIRTATVGDKADVVKQVEWTLIGTEAGQTFELPQTTTLADPNGQPFIALTQLTETEVIGWIESTDTRIEAIKSHIQYVLDKEAAKAALASTPMPWAPPVEVSAEPSATMPAPI